MTENIITIQDEEEFRTKIRLANESGDHEDIHILLDRLRLSGCGLSNLLSLFSNDRFCLCSGSN